ncbi:hypothetical protein F5Y03DRAFT_397360 [Xylaria venustula]|nr:hypothetical protein F5Y03DRAFT_397360 [Xylaria venustula]
MTQAVQKGIAKPLSKRDGLPQRSIHGIGIHGPVVFVVFFFFTLLPLPLTFVIIISSSPPVLVIVGSALVETAKSRILSPVTPRSRRLFSHFSAAARRGEAINYPVSTISYSASE